MELKFDEKFLIKHNISPNQMLILTSIKLNKRRELHKLSKALQEDPFLFDYSRLLQRDLVHGDLYLTSILTEKGKDLLDGKDLFAELLDKFPVSVIRKDGTKDYLKTDKKKCSRLYKRITRDRKDIHEHIISCLDFEITHRKQTNGIMWMKKMPNWLASEEWTTWNEKMKDEAVNNLLDTDDEYGAEIE